jgi:tryptophan synthase alpha chain
VSGVRPELERLLTARLDTGKKLFLPYLTAGLPSPQRFIELVADLAGVADAIEVGIPFSDPIMDGPVIQEASRRALESGVTVQSCFNLLRETSRHTTVPIVVMTYFNPVHRMGVERFAEALSRSGVLGLIVPDLPHEEASELASVLSQRGIALIEMVTPTSPEPRVAILGRASTGFVYAVSRLGVTGERDELGEVARPLVERVRLHTDLPVLLGIGISGGEQVRAAAAISDGVIVGSALMKKVIAGDVGGATELAKTIRNVLDEAT